MLPAFEQSCQVSNLTWVDSISSRRDDIRCSLELKCQLQSIVKPQINNWPCYMQLDGIKEQSRNMKSPQEGRSWPSCGQFRCTGQVPEGHRGQEMDVSGEECFSQCWSSTPGRWLRTSEPQDGLMRTRRTKKRWQEMEGQAQACRISEDVGNMEKSAAWAYLGRPGLRCSLRTRQIGA